MVELETVARHGIHFNQQGLRKYFDSVPGGIIAMLYQMRQTLPSGPKQRRLLNGQFMLHLCHYNLSFCPHPQFLPHMHYSWTYDTFLGRLCALLFVPSIWVVYTRIHLTDPHSRVSNKETFCPGQGKSRSHFFFGWT